MTVCEICATCPGEVCEVKGSLSEDFDDMEVSQNDGSPKRMDDNGKSESKMDDLGYHYFWKPPYRGGFV